MNVSPSDGSAEGPKLVFEPDEQRAWDGMPFLVEQLARLGERGLIPSESLKTILEEYGEHRESLRKLGLGRSKLTTARRLRATNPVEALRTVDEIRALAPDLMEPWVIAIELRTSMFDESNALELCEEANRRFSAFPINAERLKAMIAAERSLKDAGITDTLAAAKEALKRGQDLEVIAICETRLMQQPDDFDSLVLIAFAKQRLGRLDEALDHYRYLARLDSANHVWPQWIASLQRRKAEQLNEAARASQPQEIKAEEPVLSLNVPSSPILPRAEAEPTISWSEIGGQFLLGHWQKLILCLAVLLIVVSSNIGAYQLLGPKLWSPIGKCVLALIYTGMFAGFGAGLARWGAKRAGWIMLLTTLIMIPANFMLAGEMKLLTDPSTSRLAVFGLDTVALAFMIQVVMWSLDWKFGVKRLGFTYLLLCLFNATSSPGLDWPIAWQAVLFSLPAFVFLGAVSWIDTAFQRNQQEHRFEITYSSLAIFLFAFLTGLIRSGVFSLQLLPTFYAVPLMATAIALMFTASKVTEFDPESNHQAWLRYIGLVISGLAFALAIARPASPSAVYSGNTLVTSLLGLGLYAASLRVTRKPSYLYFAFGALFVAYFGAFYFTVDLLHSVEEVARKALGYQTKLPAPFRAINGLTFSIVLGVLSIYFRKVWDDPRLARHCHYIGIPFSIAACLFSSFEPKAGLICLTGYSVLYLIAIRLYAEPRVTYLAALAFTGAVYFASAVIFGARLPQETVVVAVLGLLYWGLGWRFRKADPNSAYQRPLQNVSTALATLVLIVAIGSVLPRGLITFEATLALGIVALLYWLRNLETKSEGLAYAVLITGSLAYAFLVNRLLQGKADSLGLAPYGLAAGMAALILAALGEWSRKVLSSEVEASKVVPYARPLIQIAIVEAGLSIVVGVLHGYQKFPLISTLESAAIGLGFLCTCRALMILTHVYASRTLAAISTACGLGAWVALFQVVHGSASASLSTYGLVIACYAHLMLVLEEVARVFNRKPKAADPDFQSAWFPSANLFAEVIPFAEIVVVALACGLAVYGWNDELPIGSTFLAGAIAMFWSTRFRRDSRLVDLGLALLTVATLFLTDWTLEHASFATVVAWEALSIAVASLLIGMFGRFSLERSWGPIYSQSCLRASTLLTWGVLAAAIVSRFDARHPAGTIALVVNALSLFLLTKFRDRPSLCYRGLLSTTLAIYWMVYSFGNSHRDSTDVIGLVGVTIAIGFSTVGFFLRYLFQDKPERLYSTPLFRSALIMTFFSTISSYEATWINVLIALSFLLLTQGLASRYWLYPTILFVAIAVDFAFAHQRESWRAVATSVALAYVLWFVGMIVRRCEPGIRRWIRLANGSHDEPIFNSAIGLAFLGAILQIQNGYTGLARWPESWPLALSLGGFCLLMLKPYPSSIWIHGAIVSLMTTTAMLTIHDPAKLIPWLVLGLAFANVWQGARHVLSRIDAFLKERLAIADVDLPLAAGLWSRLLFGIGSFLLAILVMTEVRRSLTLPTDLNAGLTPYDWWMVNVAIGLGLLYAITRSITATTPVACLGLWGYLLAAIWWLATLTSPIVTQFGGDPLALEPTLSAGFAFITILASLGWSRFLRWSGPKWPRWQERSPHLETIETLLDVAAKSLTLAALLMTFGTSRPSTLITLLLSTFTFSLPAILKRQVIANYVSGLFWLLAAVEATRELTQWQAITAQGDQSIAIGMALLGASAAWWWLASLSRRWIGEATISEADVITIPAGSAPLALEQCSLGMAYLSAAAILLSVILDVRPGPLAEYSAVGTLLGISLFHVAAIARWKLPSLVYPAQVSLVGSYLYYRWAFPMPIATDAIVLTLFGYLDLGLAEVMGRVGLTSYVRPTRYMAIALPILPLLLAGWDLSFRGIDLFVLFSAATFYAIATERFGWEKLGYASAVLYNAFLWFLWGQFGWTLTNQTPFFLIPVGFSAILLAEANVKELGRTGVNSIRTIGLILIYCSLAMPIWQTQSFAAWLTLLLLSIVGIFAGIALRVQTFLWLGLAGFVLDVVYQLGRVSLDHTLARWGVMLLLGITMVIFVALNEKKAIVASLRSFVNDARQWD